MFFRKRNPKIIFEIINNDEEISIKVLWGRNTPIDNLSTLINLINHGGFFEEIESKVEDRGHKIGDGRTGYILSHLVNPNHDKSSPLVPPDKMINLMIKEGLNDDGID
jgi:hypothetical protein